jgi:hypothetical protein
MSGMSLVWTRAERKENFIREDQKERGPSKCLGVDVRIILKY